MKKMKKLAALVLALVMAFSLMAVTAAAAGAEHDCAVCSEETIQPRIPSMHCPKCREGMFVTRVYKDQYNQRVVDFECPYDGTTVLGIPW